MASRVTAATNPLRSTKQSPMARKKIARGLPPLPSRPTFKATKHKGVQLLEILRGIAIANQQEEPQLFYPIREVARRLGVPVSTVSRVYGALEGEGILVSVRGSKTLLQGLTGGRHLSVLGFMECRRSHLPSLLFRIAAHFSSVPDASFVLGVSPLRRCFTIGANVKSDVSSRGSTSMISTPYCGMNPTARRKKPCRNSKIEVSKSSG